MSSTTHHVFPLADSSPLQPPGGGAPRSPSNTALWWQQLAISWLADGPSAGVPPFPGRVQIARALSGSEGRQFPCEF